MADKGLVQQLGFAASRRQRGGQSHENMNTYGNNKARPAKPLEQEQI